MISLKDKFTKNVDLLLYFLLVLTAFLIPFNKSIPEISLLIMLISGLYLHLIRGFKFELFKEYKYILVAAIFFFSWLIFRSIIQPSTVEFKNIFRYIGILFLPLLILLSATCLKKNRKQHILYAFISANLIIAVYSIFAAVFTGIYWDIGFMSLFPISWFPGTMAFSIPAVICLLIAPDKHQRIKIVLWIALIFLVSCIYMASRRGIILSVALSSGLLVLIELWASQNRVYRITLGILIVVLSILLLSNPRFDAIKDYQGYKYDIRLTMWETALKMVARTPTTFVMGYGLEKGYEDYSQRLREIDYFPQNMKVKFNSAHNDFLDIFIMFGLGGLAGFLLLLFFSIHHSIKNKNLFLFAFIMMVSVQFFFGSYYFWFRTGKYSFFFFFAYFLVFQRPFKTPSQSKRIASMGN